MSWEWYVMGKYEEGLGIPQLLCVDILNAMAYQLPPLLSSPLFSPLSLRRAPVAAGLSPAYALPRDRL